MFEYNHEVYTLTHALTPIHHGQPHATEPQRVSFTLTPEDPTADAALESPTRLIYAVILDREVFYIGEARSSLLTRLRRGFAAYRRYLRNGHALNGYKGYKWIPRLIEDNNLEIEVHAFIFGADFDPDERRCEIEAVEGDMAYLVRTTNGKWPTYQNEIHFGNHAGAPETAKQIIKDMGEKIGW